MNFGPFEINQIAFLVTPLVLLAIGLGIVIAMEIKDRAERGSHKKR